MVSAFKSALQDPGHPVLGGRDIWVGPEFPAVEANYPGVWVTFDPDPTLQVAGIGHVEYRDEESGQVRAGTRWSFSGTVSATVVSLSRRDRDELLDELVRLVAFSKEHPETGHLKAGFEANPFIAVIVAFDQMSLGGLSDSGRAPWGSDETIYEGTLTLRLEGTFVSDLLSERTLVRLSEIIVIPELDESPDPRFSDGWH